MRSRCRSSDPSLVRSRFPSELGERSPNWYWTPLGRARTRWAEWNDCNPKRKQPESSTHPHSAHRRWRAWEHSSWRTPLHSSTRRRRWAPRQWWCLSSPFPNVAPVQPVHDGELPVRHRNVRPRVVLCRYWVADSLDALLPAERSAWVETAHNSSFPLSAFRMFSKHLTASSSSPRGLKQRVVTFFGVL